jgi:hypothetical protein
VNAAHAPRLCDWLLEISNRAEASLGSGPARREITAMRQRLQENVLRIAIGGRLNAGKSTLVNALLGEKLADTGATECTRLVTMFRFGPMNRIHLYFSDGETQILPAQPVVQAIRAAGREPSDVTLIERESSNAILRSYTIVDTPGLDSLSELDPVSLSALRQADVLLYLMPHPGEGDHETLTALRATVSEAGATAITTIGVLSRIDQLDSGMGDPRPRAREIARNSGEFFSGLLSQVIPLVGILAETALGNTFTEDDMLLIQALTNIPAGALANLHTYEDFKEYPALPIGDRELERLLSLLGTYGLKTAIEIVNEGTQGAASLLKALQSRSGIDVLLDRIQRQFLNFGDALRARHAIQALDAASWLGSSPTEKASLIKLRDDLDQVRQHPKFRQLSIAEVFADLNTRRWQTTQEFTDELAALAHGTDLPAQLRINPASTPDELRALLSTSIAAWRTLANSERAATARYPRTVYEYLELLYSTLPLT